jgi:hypothetical protein
MEDVGVDMRCEQAHGQERPFDQGADDIGSTCCMPILYTMAMLTPRCVAMRTWRIMSKATFIKVNDDAAFALIAFNFFPGRYTALLRWPLGDAGFFYKTRPDALKHN